MQGLPRHNIRPWHAVMVFGHSNGSLIRLGPTRGVFRSLFEIPALGAVLLKTYPYANAAVPEAVHAETEQGKPGRRGRRRGWIAARETRLRPQIWTWPSSGTSVLSCKDCLTYSHLHSVYSLPLVSRKMFGSVDSAKPEEEERGYGAGQPRHKRIKTSGAYRRHSRSLLHAIRHRLPLFEFSLRLCW